MKKKNLKDQRKEFRLSKKRILEIMCNLKEYANQPSQKSDLDLRINDEIDDTLDKLVNILSCGSIDDITISLCESYLRELEIKALIIQGKYIKNYIKRREKTFNYFIRTLLQKEMRPNSPKVELNF